MSSYSSFHSGDMDDEFGGEGPGEGSLESTEFRNKDALLIMLDCHESMFKRPSQEPAPSTASQLSTQSSVAGTGGSSGGGSSGGPLSSVSLKAAAPEPDASELTHFQEAVRAIVSLIKTKVIASGTDQVGVCLFNTKKKSNENDFDGVYVLRDVERPDAELIKATEALADEKVARDTVGVGADGACQFFQALWVASALLSKPALSKNSYRRLFVFTANPDPTWGDRAQADRALSRANDLQEMDIMIELLKVRQFDARRFYADMVMVEEDEDDGRLDSDPTSVLEDLRVRLRRKEFKKRALASVRFELGKGVAVGVRLYVMLKRAAKGTAKKVDARTNESLTTRTRYLCAETGGELEKSQIRHYREYGGEPVYFTAEEVKELKEFGPPGLVLLGFKDASRVKVFHNVKSPYFVYPHEEAITGSTAAFAALLGQMHKLGKVAVARLIYRRGSVPRIVALFPQVERIGGGSGQDTPPGLNLVFLPYADDVRRLQFEPQVIASEELVNAAHALVDRCKLKVRGWNYVKNPTLQRHYAVLQALALDDEVPEETPDELAPPPYRKAPPAIDNLEAKITAAAEVLDAQKAAAAPPKKGTKRKASGGGGAAKRARTGGADDDEDPAAGIDFAQRAADGTLSKLTMPQLKSYLRRNGLPVGGRKADLVERVEEHLG